MEEGDDNHLRNWVLEGCDKVGADASEDMGWEEISAHTDDDTINDENLVSIWRVFPKRPYRWFRLRLTGPSSGGKVNFCITQMEFWGYLMKDSETGHAGSLTPDSPEIRRSQTALANMC